jgi:hypothetical protein
MSASDDEKMCLEPSRDQEIAKLILAVEKHEFDAMFIELETERLGLDAKTLGKIRSLKKTMDALMGIDPATAERVAK